MKISIVGADWNTCYLHECPERRKQVLDDLQTEINQTEIIPLMTVMVDVTDHSSATEMFQVQDIRPSEDSVLLSYCGGIS